MSDVWYYADQSRRVGPLSRQEMKNVLGALPSPMDVMVWRDGYSDWRKVEFVPELWPRANIPPPLPGAAPPEPADDIRGPVSAPKSFRRRGKLGKIVVAVVILVAASVGGVVGHQYLRWNDRPAIPFISSPLEREVIKAESELKVGLPRKLNDFTTLVGVSHEGTKLIYLHRLEMSSAKIDYVYKDRVQNFVTSDVCYGHDTRSVLDAGGSYRYSYTDNQAKPVFWFDVVKGSCR